MNKIHQYIKSKRNVTPLHVASCKKLQNAGSKIKNRWSKIVQDDFTLLSFSSTPSNKFTDPKGIPETLSKTIMIGENPTS